VFYTHVHSIDFFQRKRYGSQGQIQMRISEASELIRADQISEGSSVQTWCDLGCGTGTFTLALATLLPPGSTIYAIDRDEKALAEIPEQYEGVTIRKQVMTWDLSIGSLPRVDGVLMANLLHFMEDQNTALSALRSIAARLLIVEYEGRAANPWVPYPVSFLELQGMLLHRGFTQVRRLSTRPSRFGGELYSSIAQ